MQASRSLQRFNIIPNYPKYQICTITLSVIPTLPEVLQVKGSDSLQTNVFQIVVVQTRAILYYNWKPLLEATRKWQREVTAGHS